MSSLCLDNLNIVFIPAVADLLDVLLSALVGAGDLLLFGHTSDPDENGGIAIEEENIRVDQIFLGEVGHFFHPHEAGCI